LAGRSGRKQERKELGEYPRNDSYPDAKSLGRRGSHVRLAVLPLGPSSPCSLGELLAPVLSEFPSEQLTHGEF